MVVVRAEFWERQDTQQSTDDVDYTKTVYPLMVNSHNVGSRVAGNLERCDRVNRQFPHLIRL